MELKNRVISCMKKPSAMLGLEHSTMDPRSDYSDDYASVDNQNALKMSRDDELRLERLVNEEGLIYVTEEHLKQDRMNQYTGYIDQTGKRKGLGTKVFRNGDRYEGEWSNDKANGKGRYEHQDGDVYEGFWKDDMAHGQGLYTSANGSSYFGDWENDL